MMIHLVPMLLAAPLLVAAAPQDDPLPAPSEAAVERVEELEEELQDYIATWRKEQGELRQKHAAAVEKAKAEGQPAPKAPALSRRPDYGTYLEKLAGWADETGGEDAALYLSKLVEISGFQGDQAMAAMDRLVADHAASSAWAGLGNVFSYFPRIFGPERADEIFTALEANPSPDVQGWLALGRYTSTIEEADRDSEEYKVARAAVLAAAEKAKDAGLKGDLQGLVDLREKLGVGATAPDIAGIDLDGVEFKMSDYKGKVVFLDFWGDW